MPTTVNLRAKGLNISPNALTLEPGSLVEATNVIIRRDDVVEPRRGFELWGESLGSTGDTAKQLLQYRQQLIRHYNSVLEVQDGTNNDGTPKFTAFSTAITEPSSGRRLRAVQTNGNFYFTSSDGVQKLSSSTNNIANTSISPAGGVKATDIQARIKSFLASTSGFLPSDSAVAYRVVWGIKDANANLILGTPSPRTEVFNYLLNNVIEDFNRTLIAVDALNQSGSMVTDGNYVSTLKLTATSSGDQLRTNLIAFAEKLDNDILYANTTGVGVPLTISTAVIASGICTITFSSGTVTDYFAAGSKFYLSGFTPISGTLDGAQTASSVTSTTLVFNTTASGTVTIDPAASIVSNEYRSITQPDALSLIPTHDELAALQTYLEAILNRLQIEPVAVISSALSTTYLTPLEITTNVAVELNINIPQDITTNHFYQVYRSAITQAVGTGVLSDLTPSDELQLVLENYPTATEITQGYLIVEDITADDFRGANLYTNPSTGEGITQANDVPPLATDINTFKGYTFYSNTTTRHRTSLSLLGVSNLLTEAQASNNPTLTITSNTGTQTYSFVLGARQKTEVTCIAAGLVNTAAPATYFLVHSADNTEKFYVWYKIGSAQDPAVSGYTGLQVNALVTDTNTQIAEKTRDAFSAVPSIFTATSSTNILTIENYDAGYSAGVSAGTSGFAFTTLVSGVGEKVAKEQTEIICVADVAGSLAGTYFTANTAFDLISYYIWYKVSGVGVDPAIANKTGILVNIATNDTADTVAATTQAALDSYFTASVDTNVLTLVNSAPGPATNATAGTSGFTVSVLDEGALQVLISDNVSPAQAVDETSRSLVTIINQNEADTVYAYYLSGAQDVPGKMLLEARSLGDPTFYVQANNEAIGTSFSPDISPVLEITNIATGSPTSMLVTTASAHGFLNQDTVVISGTNCVPNINGTWSITYVSSTTFRINATVISAGTDGGVSAATATQFSENEQKAHRLYYSKYQQPEAVPIVNYIDIGATDKEILRIFPLRDSLFVFKEDGLYRLSGEVSPFSVGLFDSSCILTAPDSVDVSNNLIYAWTTQGISTISESGISVISRPIDTIILPKRNYTNFKTATWGMGYESDQAYLVFTVAQTNDEVANVCYRFSALTNSWTVFDKTNTCGLVNILDDKIYMGAGDVNYLEKERKDFTRYDYADRVYEKTLTSGNYFNTYLKLSNVDNITAGDVLVQDQTLTVYEFNALLKKLDLDPGVSDADYFSTLAASAGDNLKTKLLALTAKLDADSGIVTTDFTTSISAKSGSISAISVASSAIITATSHGLADQRKIIISGSNSTPTVDGNFIVTVIDANTFSIPLTTTSPGTSGSWATLDTTFDDLKACYNKVINKLNADSGTDFQNYKLLDNNTIQETVVLAVNKNTKQITLNNTLDFVVGVFSIYKAINTNITYSPVFGDDPATLKHLREATVMFSSKAFTKANLSFSTDLLPMFIPVEFEGTGNGSFGIGSGTFGANFFGGASHSAPFRTYVPRNCQRCRYINIRFSHGIARESYAIYGISLTGEFGLSSRGYR